MEPIQASAGRVDTHARGGGAHPIVACLSHLTIIEHASRSTHGGRGDAMTTQKRVKGH